MKQSCRIIDPGDLHDDFARFELMPIDINTIVKSEARAVNYTLISESSHGGSRTAPLSVHRRIPSLKSVTAREPLENRQSVSNSIVV